MLDAPKPPDPDDGGFPAVPGRWHRPRAGRSREEAIIHRETLTELGDFDVCGFPPMFVGTKTRLRELWAPDERIHSEGWEDSVIEDD